MNTVDKIKLLQELLERRYPADIYDVSAKTVFSACVRSVLLVNCIN